ncbi:unnamed protein product [Nesidiocoris tenuis]|uniref:Uncharacterized protein n=1 Tax=Nesidiocoris tenuis TaxID=355587 RepID=A0A6H5FYT6_9HEMI|nr:unnamed protein product [Nesidiocoris tenuis]
MVDDGSEKRQLKEEGGLVLIADLKSSGKMGSSKEVETEVGAQVFWIEDQFCSAGVWGRAESSLSKRRLTPNLGPAGWPKLFEISDLGVYPLPEKARTAEQDGPMDQQRHVGFIRSCDAANRGGHDSRRTDGQAAETRKSAQRSRERKPAYCETWCAPAVLPAGTTSQGGGNEVNRFFRQKNQ